MLTRRSFFTGAFSYLSALPVVGWLFTKEKKLGFWEDDFPGNFGYPYPSMRPSQLRHPNVYTGVWIPTSKILPARNMDDSRNRIGSQYSAKVLVCHKSGLVVPARLFESGWYTYDISEPLVGYCSVWKVEDVIYWTNIPQLPLALQPMSDPSEAIVDWDKE